MKFVSSMVLAMAVFCGSVLSLQAADKEVTLKGDFVCAKCTLKQEKKCTTAIKVKEDGKEVTYLLKDKGVGESYHEAVCGGGSKAGTVTGVVSEKDGKKWITPSKVEYAK